ncbi:MAG: AbrB/MazE/SpoVT family DNA-binding domain-containing protein [Oscillospiraceae bacterium]|jgi:transcriptional pleiotropic regulator of transition state genes|nr:AbrB/MazE/SpoVT family DNA-binding domain-containing protein [Oscillospiraceae bacterium]
MKETGITRKLDELGRIVLPIELRRSLELNEKNAMEIYVEGDTVILKKHVQKKVPNPKKQYVCAECGKNIPTSDIEDGLAVEVRAARKPRAAKLKNN